MNEAQAIVNNSSTMTQVALNKQAMRFLESIDHSRYILDGKIKDIPLLKKERVDNKVKVYVYFDDGVEGDLENINLIDTDGDIVAIMDRKIIKESRKGFYALFSYVFKEEVISNEI